MGETWQAPYSNHSFGKESPYHEGWDAVLDECDID